jgi:transcriptional regulator with XRE-family HTH domain
MSDDPTPPYATELGHRLREIRQQQGLSLHGVQAKSGDRWKAVVIGSYERGDRSITAHRLAELASFYGVPLARLLPGAESEQDDPPVRRRLMIDLQELQRRPLEEARPLIRYVAAIQDQRGDYNGRVLSIRQEDLRALAIIYDRSPSQLADQLVEWGVLGADQTRMIDLT